MAEWRVRDILSQSCTAVEGFEDKKIRIRHDRYLGYVYPESFCPMNVHGFDKEKGFLVAKPKDPCREYTQLTVTKGMSVYYRYNFWESNEEEYWIEKDNKVRHILTHSDKMNSEAKKEYDNEGNDLEMPQWVKNIKDSFSNAGIYVEYE